MRIDISGIPEEGLQRELEFPLSLNDVEREDTAHVFVDISKFGKRVLVKGTVKMSATVTCGRCLNEFMCPIDISFREEYLPAGDISSEEEKELTIGELDLSYYRNGELDVTELIREQVLLSLPMKPLCGSECRGICPQCGKDMNDGPCSCSKDEIDPRLAPLQKIKELIKDRKE